MPNIRWLQGGANKRELGCKICVPGESKEALDGRAESRRATNRLLADRKNIEADFFFAGGFFLFGSTCRFFLTVQPPQRLQLHLAALSSLQVHTEPDLSYLHSSILGKLAFFKRHNRDCNFESTNASCLRPFCSAKRNFCRLHHAAMGCLCLKRLN